VEDITLKDISLTILKGSNSELFGGDLDFRPNLFIAGGAKSAQPIYVQGVKNFYSENVKIQ